jgi:hypothetical protein
MAVLYARSAWRSGLLSGGPVPAMSASAGMRKCLVSRVKNKALDPSRTRTCVALVLAAAARPAVAPAPETRRPHVGARARPRPEDRLPQATRWPAGLSRYPRGHAGNDPP